MYAMHGWVCAYCQCELPRNDRGDIEHFRPKNGGYWWLAYVFDNYLLSCSVCNRERKRDLFPVAMGSLRVEYASRGGLAAEARLLLDPASDPVESWMRIEWAEKGRAAFVNNHAPTPSPTALERTAETIRFFGLNFHPDLYTPRRRALEAATKVLRQRERVPADLDAVRRAASRYQPYGIVIRNFLEDVEPSLLPSSADEITWFLDDLEERLRDAHHLLKLGIEDLRYCKRAINVLCWTLAVLWKDPPPGTSAAAMEDWLTARGWKAEVEALRAELG